MGALCAAIAIIAVVLPHAGGLGLLGTVPMGLLAYRYRIRVLITATVAAAVIGFLVVGLSGFGAVALCAYVGGLAGIVKRRGHGPPTVTAASLGAGVVAGAVVVIALTVLAGLRQLLFHAITAAVNGVATVLARVPHLQAVAQEVKRIFAGALDYWQWLALGFAVVAIMGASLIGWWALSRVLERLGGIPDVHKLDASTDTGPIQPVPVRLDEVRLRYPHTDHDALRAVSLDVRPAEHVAVTGANGSGKTTLFNVITGYERTDEGEVYLNDRKITNLPPDKVFALGIGRTFQLTRIFASLTVLENMLVASPTGGAAARKRAMEQLEFVGIAGHHAALAGTLSYGQRKLLELAYVLVSDPAVILLDEPAGGVNLSLVNHIADRIRELNAAGKTFLIVEHNMEFVMGLCDRVTVLDSGAVVAAGPPDIVRADRRVLDAYLGEDIGEAEDLPDHAEDP